MSAEVTQTEAETEVEYTPEYGDRFRNRQTNEVLSIQDVRDGVVTFSNGAQETVEDLQAAVEGIHFAYEVLAVGDDRFEGDGYGDY